MAKAKKEPTTEAKPRGRAPNPEAKNGVSPPAAGTTSAAVWAVCDKLNGKGTAATPSVVAEEVMKKHPDVNLSTLKTQIARWRQFNGMTVARA
jgi:hypothetical protein